MANGNHLTPLRRKNRCNLASWHIGILAVGVESGLERNWYNVLSVSV